MDKSQEKKRMSPVRLLCRLLSLAKCKSDVVPGPYPVHVLLNLWSPAFRVCP